jgi:hypothetical protein
VVRPLGRFVNRISDSEIDRIEKAGWEAWQDAHPARFERTAQKRDALGPIPWGVTGNSSLPKHDQKGNHS